MFFSARNYVCFQYENVLGLPFLERVLLFLGLHYGFPKSQFTQIWQLTVEKKSSLSEIKVCFPAFLSQGNMIQALQNIYYTATFSFFVLFVVSSMV